MNLILSHYLKSVTYQIDELLNTAPCGYLSFTDDGTIVIANATLLELLEYKADELWGRKIELLLPISSRIFYQTHFFPLLKLHGKVEEIYFPLKSKHGNNIPILVNAVRRKNADTFINICIFISIHQRIQYEDELLQSKKVAETAIKAQKQAEMTLRQQSEQAVVLRDITQRINQSFDLHNIFEIATQKIRELVRADRVGIFKFYDDSYCRNGRFISESVLEEFNSNLGVQIHDDCFDLKYANFYKKGRIQVIDDIENSGIAECHRKILAQLQVRANIVMPLLSNGDNLWGLLCIHQCSAPRHWQEIEIDFIRQIAIQLTIAIQQADLFEQRQQAEVKLRQSNEELYRATQALEKLVNTDGLTRIPNRRCFDNRLEQEWQRLYREQQFLSLILFDVDYFKRYNDSYGHQMGDECLIKIAQAVNAVVCRPADLVARYGGEEFTVILPNTDLDGAIAVAQKIHTAIQDLAIPHSASEVSDIVTISLGITSQIPNSEVSPADLIEQADRRLSCQTTRA